MSNAPGLALEDAVNIGCRAPIEARRLKRLRIDGCWFAYIHDVVKRPRQWLSVKHNRPLLKQLERYSRQAIFRQQFREASSPLLKDGMSPLRIFGARAQTSPPGVWVRKGPVGTLSLFEAKPGN